MASANQPGKHIANDFTTSDLHGATNGYEDGRCLSGSCEPNYKEISCSYRYQGVYQVEKLDERIYRRHPRWPHTSSADETGFVRRRRTDATKLPAAKTELAAKVAGMIASGAIASVHGGAKQWRKKEGGTYSIKGWKQEARAKRFRTAFSPYANTPHHIVPWIQLGNAIDASCDPAGPRKADLIMVVQKGLADERYNINHHHNILVLPHEYPDACATFLPTHYLGFNHPAYSGDLGELLADALEPYEALAEEMEEHGDPPDPLDLKEELVSLAAHVKQLLIRDGEAVMDQLCAAAADHAKTQADPERKRAKVNLDKLWEGIQQQSRSVTAIGV